MKIQHCLQVATALAVAMVVPAAQAHIGSHGTGFGAGMAHPFIGLDHLLAMVAVGIWAALLGGRALWQVLLAAMCALSMKK
jgi:urease accessory protein